MAQGDVHPKELLIAVDEEDRALQPIEKLDCHRLRVLHRAVSGFVFSSDGKLLVQQRAFSKYHCGGAFANSCCSHPHWGEEVDACMRRRMREELGLDLTFHHFGTFRYDLPVSDALFENELVHLFWATTDCLPKLNPEEVANFEWMTLEAIGGMKVETMAPWFEAYWRAGVVAEAFARSTTAIGASQDV